MQKTLPSHYQFRPLSEEDLQHVAEFECEIALQSFGDEAITDPAFHKKRLLASVGRLGAIVAETDTGEIAGWALVTSRKNASTQEEYGDFKSFYIAENYRGGRLAFMLISEIIDYALRNEWTRLVGRTAADNAAMQAVYRFFQFEPKHVVYEMALEKRESATKKPPTGGDAFPHRSSIGKKRSRRKKGSRQT